MNTISYFGKKPNVLHYEKIGIHWTLSSTAIHANIKFKKCISSLFLNRYDVYAVFRSIEEPTSPRKTSLIFISDEVREEMTEVRLWPITCTIDLTSVSSDWNQTHVVIFLLQKVLHRNTWYPYHNMSTEGDVYGVGFCAEYSLTRKYNREDYPLYYFLGYANMSLKIFPGVYVQ